MHVMCMILDERGRLSKFIEPGGNFLLYSDC